MSVTKLKQLFFIITGTQMVAIKREEETEIVIKEEEPAIDVEYGDFCSDQNTIQLHDLTAMPLVYTTRLDDMNTFDNIGRHTSQEAAEMIVEESKPHYKPSKVKPELSSDPCINSYIKLCCQIQQLNTKVKNETRLRNQKLLDMCKPLKIHLENLKTSKRRKQSKEILYCRNSSDEYMPSFNSSEDDDEPISKLVPESQLLAREQAAMLATSTMPIIVTVKDKRSQEADIYILDSKRGVKNYYRTNIKECESLEKLHLSKKTILIEYCCWVNRDKRISRLIQLGFTRSSIFYLRKPHNCLPRPCSCCCVFGTHMLNKGIIIPQKNIESLENKEVSVTVNSNSVIDKAKNYMPNVPDPPITKKQTKDFLESAVIIIKYHRVIFSQTNILGDNYEIGKDGELLNFLRPTVNRSIPEEKQLYEKYDRQFHNNSRTYFTYLVCCWHKREGIIMRLVDINNLKPNIIFFLRTPHPCRSDKCICCCKPHPCSDINFNNISTFKKNTNMYRKVPVVVTDKEKRNIISSKSKRPNQNTLNKDVDMDIQSIKTSNRHKPTRIINKTKPQIGLNKECASQDNNKLSFNSRSAHYPAVKNSQTSTNNKQNESTVNKIMNLSSANTVSTTTPTTLINKILDRFKGLILSVNENGKLTAIINTAPGTLSTVEIKVISDILLHASSQIEQLGITPQEFCNRVNSSRTGNNNTLMPQLVPINTNLNEPQTSDNTQVHNTLPTPLECDTPKDTNCCKVQPPNSCIPTTSHVYSIYQVMSSLGGQKNKNLVRAYKSHFKNVYTVDKCDQLKRQQNQQKTEKTSNIDKLRTATSEAAVTKRKKRQKLDQNKKKLRVKPPQELLVENPQHGFEDSLNIIDQTVLNTFQNTRKSSVQNLVVGHNPPPLIVNNSNFIQLQDTVGTIAPGSVQNQIPCFVSNTNLIPGQNTKSKGVPQLEMRTKDNQMPLLVLNGNFTAGQNTRGMNAPQPTVGSLHGQVPFTVANNSRLIPVQNKSGIKVAQATTGTFLNQIPDIVTKNNVILIPKTSGTRVPQPNKNVSSFGTFFPVEYTHKTLVPSPTSDEIPVDNSGIIDIKAENCSFDEHVTESDIEVPPASKTDSLPMQNIINAVVSSVAHKPKGLVPSVNPLLYKMLSQAHASPSLPQVDPKPSAFTPLTHNYPNKKVSAQSIQARTTKKPCKKNIRTYTNKRKSSIAPRNDTDMDFESSITSTVIKVKSDKFTNDEILDAVNNKQLIASDEGESIFGV